MARTKDFDTHIKSRQEELSKAEARVLKLREEIQTLEKQKQEYEMTALYKYMQVHSLQVKDIVPNFESEIQNDTVNRPRRTSVNNRTSSANREIKDTNTKRTTKRQSAQKNSSKNATTRKRTTKKIAENEH